MEQLTIKLSTARVGQGVKTMKAHEYLNLRINRVDTIAAQQSGLLPLFYAIKRCYGDDQASSYLRAYKKTKDRPSVVFIAGGNATRF